MSAGGNRSLRVQAWALRVTTVLLAASLTGACAARSFSPPTDPGIPLADFASVYAGVSRACATLRTFTAELGLTGRVGDERVRGRVLAGFRTPDAMRLEGVAPIGAPAFILVATGGTASLVLPRDNAAVTAASPEDLLDALTGVALAPADLLAVLTGCVVPAGRARAGFLHGANRASIVLEPEATLFLERRGQSWTVRGARRQGWTIEYPAEWRGAFPSRVVLRAQRGAVAVDLAATVGQIDANVEVDGRAFEVERPPMARTVTLDDLRAAGPLRGQP